MEGGAAGAGAVKKGEVTSSQTWVGVRLRHRVVGKDQALEDSGQ